MNREISSVSFYDYDKFGSRIRVGLTFAETCEFEKTDASPPMNKNDALVLPWETDWHSLADIEIRWRDLYEKHLRAMRYTKSSGQ